MKKTHKGIRPAVLIPWLFLAVFSGCLPKTSSGPSDDTFFKPPTLPSPEQTTELATGSSQPLQSTPPCQNGLAFIADVTIPDGTVAAPGEVLIKTWEVENIGSCGWTADYSIRHVGGSALGAGSSLPLYPARAGARAMISIRFTAPPESGTIHSAWRAYSPDGQPFGDAVYIQINVSASPPIETP